ncbi:MAG: DUF4440 domain-containing protein [Gammaproteobacteria bacterium]|nr:DUF4440 domain-containing protein [Gammaproteobacteria bacterium]MDH5628600.1 DUF4440 domain-containing protein [Gammaproteobacteria bacterium]
MNPKVRSSYEELDKYLSDDFIEIASTGVQFDKAHALSRIPHEVSPDFWQQDFSLNKFKNTLAQLVYKAAIKHPDSEEIKYSRRSSIWRFNGDVWQMIFHQGTLCEPFEIHSPS